MQLNRELTEKMFKCQSKEDVKALIDSGADLSTVSRMALDEALSKVFNKRCTGLKELAVKMLIGAANGEDIPDVPVTPSFNQPKPTAAPSIDPAERAARIKSRIEDMVASAKDHFVRMNQFKRDPELKMLGVADDDLKVTCSGHEQIVCGADSSGKLYVMNRDQKTMDELSSKWGDRYF